MQVDGVLVNFNSAATAKEQLQEVAGEMKGTITNKDKGLRFTAENGKIVGWTNGSLMCLVKSSAGTKPAANFEEAVLLTPNLFWASADYRNRRAVDEIGFAPSTFTLMTWQMAKRFARADQKLFNQRIFPDLL